MPPIKSLSGDLPHPSRGTWEEFLASSCEVRDQCRGVTYYGATNCNYVVFPCGTLVQSYGYKGRALMSEIRRRRSPGRVLAEIKEFHREIDAILHPLKESNDAAT